MNRTSPTLRDVAERAGASYSAVSRALNGVKGVRPELREKILQAARELNYFSDSSARALVQKKVRTIGLAIHRRSDFVFESPFFGKLLNGMSEIVNKAGYQLLLSIDNEVSMASLFHSRQVDGLIVFANTIKDESLIQLYREDIPVVAIPGFPPQSKIVIHSVNSENFKSIFRAVNYLIELGHRRVAFIMGEPDTWYSIERFNAFQQAFVENNLTYEPALVRYSDLSISAGYRLMGELLDLEKPPTSVICIHDSITPGALHQIKCRNLSMPGDISFVAVGCSDTYELFNPSLTTVKTPAVEIGKVAARKLIEIIEKGRTEERHTILASDLIIRESTGKAPQS